MAGRLRVALTSMCWPRRFFLSSPPDHHLPLSFLLLSAHCCGCLPGSPCWSPVLLTRCSSPLPLLTAASVYKGRLSGRRCSFCFRNLSFSLSFSSRGGNMFWLSERTTCTNGLVQVTVSTLHYDSNKKPEYALTEGRLVVGSNSQSTTQ